MKHSPREHQRVYISFYLRVFEDNKFLGFLIDISKDGFMIMSEFLLEKDKNYEMKMKLPSSLEWRDKKDKDRFVDLTAKCVWSKHDEVDKEFYLSGFEFTDLEEKTNSIIHQLIEELRIK